MASAANPALLTRFLTFINPKDQSEQSNFSTGPGQFPALKPTDCLLLTVSGGLDSVVMADLCYQAGLRFAIAHVNFGLRGQESDQDAVFVENLALKYGVGFHTTHFHTNVFAGQTGLSIQMAARTLRYDWFEQIRAEHDYTYIATAHHRNDVLETLLLNITRGTGLAGLHGIAGWQGRIIRPLLFADRADLETYAATRQLDWREDRSNATDIYARNRIRHHVVPVLQDINQNLLQTLSTTVERLRAAETLMNQELTRAADLVIKRINEVTQIDLVLLRNFSEPAFRLAEWLRPYGYTYQQSVAIWLATEQGNGQAFSSATHRVIHERHYLMLYPVSTPVISAPKPIEITTFPGQGLVVSKTHQLTFRLLNIPADFKPSLAPLTASFDAGRLTFPLLVRRWQAGDRFRPLGLNGQKLVSDLLTDQKVSGEERKQTLVLLSGGQIAWVIGHRLDHRFRVTTQSQQVLEVAYVEI